MAAAKAFRDSYLGNDFDKNDYVSWDARRVRYAILWSMYENSAYQRMHLWAQKYKADYGLYEFIRPIYNPAYRLGEFWKIHLLGGRLSVVEGEATAEGALPIITDNGAIRKPLATLWRWSNWQTRKDIFALRTAVMGDGVIRIVDAPARQKVYLKIVHPGTLKQVDLDDWGNVKGYEIEERRPDPRKDDSTIMVTYREVATRAGDNVAYKTYLDNNLYDWDGNGSSWSVPYTFVPMVLAQHNDVGLDFGMSELFPGLAKFREVDDIASKLSDQIRKTVDSPWLMAGVKRSDLTTTERSSAKDGQAGRQGVPVFYAGADAKAQALVAPLDIAGTSAYILDILKGIEADYPEMTADKNNAQGSISGRALRINRAPAANKVQQLRPNYDDALVRAHQMAIGIGGWRNYPGFEGFGLGSYDAGDLEHHIDDREVFDKDPLDEIEQDTAFWTAAKIAKDAGVPLVVFLVQSGWDEKQIAMITNSPEYKMRMEAMQLALDAAQTGPQPAGKAQRQDDDGQDS